MEKEDISKAFNAFEKKMQRFMESGSLERTTARTPEQKLKKQIDERELVFQQTVINTYRSFVKPISTEVENDQVLISKAYDLYKAVYEAALTVKDDYTSLAQIEIQSPLTSKECYTTGDKFIYLAAWLYYEKKCTEYIPYLERTSSGKFRLLFNPARFHKYSLDDKEVLSVIQRISVQ